MSKAILKRSLEGSSAPTHKPRQRSPLSHISNPLFPHTMTTTGAIADSSPGGEQLVTSLKPTDVLLGRGSGPNDHEGNVLFRGLVKERKSEYMATNYRKTKAKIAREIVNAVLVKSGRFLRKIDPEEAKKLGISYEADVWCPVDEQTCMEKAKQALRQKAENGRGDSPDSPPSQAASVSTFEDTSASMPPETQDRYAHESSDVQVRYSPISLSRDMRHKESHWNTSHPNLLPMSSQSPWQLSHPSPGAFLFTEEAPPPQQMSPCRMVELNPEHCAGKVHHNAFSGEDEEVDNGPEDDTLENTLRIKGALRSFHQVGADDTESFHNHYSSNSNDAMGTAERLISMDASNASMMSMSSVFKGALFDTPSCTPRLGGARQDPSLFSYHRESSDCYTYSYDSDNNGHSYESRFSYGRDASCRIPRTEHFCASDRSKPLSHLGALWGECSMNEEDATNPSCSVNSRPVLELMHKSPIGDSSLNNITQAAFDYKSGES